MKTSHLGLLGATVMLVAQAAWADWNERGCEHRVIQPTARQQSGHYEQRAVQHVVPGMWQQVWVPGGCGRPEYGGFARPHRFRGHMCRAGYYQPVWQPSRVETSVQWVWVVDAAWQEQQPASTQYQYQYQAPQDPELPEATEYDFSAQL